MPEDYSHKYLKNPTGFSQEFTRNNRFPGNQSDNNEEEEKEELPVVNYSSKKQGLYNNLNTLNLDRDLRHNNRTIEVPVHIDYVRIYFHKVFDKSLQLHFRNTYGLSPVIFGDFNFTILFAITDTTRFEVFREHVGLFYELDDDEDPHGKPFSRLLLIDQFKFLKTEDIILEFGEEFVTEFKLIDSIETTEEYYSIRKELLSYLEENELEAAFTSTTSTIEVINLTRAQCNTIVNNFDIISSVQALRSILIRPSDYGIVIRDYDFTIEVNDNAPLVGVIDTGVSIIDPIPIRGQVVNYGYDLSNPDAPLPILDSTGHGTAVAGLIILGKEFYEEIRGEYKAKARVVPIKVLENEEGSFSINKLIQTIRSAYQDHGIRIFNLSVNSAFNKSYNDNISAYAYELDKLSYELDIIIHISTGNHDSDEIANMQANPNVLHNYPNHFYNPYRQTMEHCCEVMNINSPSESYNNITVGAKAENFNDSFHLTLDSNYPAYYTKKYFLDYSKRINGALPTKSIISNTLFKPDLICAGGDVTNNDSALQVISNNPTKFYEKRSGTSLATPLITSLSAEISQKYPTLNTQSIKALLINSASIPFNKNFIDGLMDSIKQEGAQEFFGKDYTNLDNAEKHKVDVAFNKDRLCNYLAGYGEPNRKKCLDNDPNSVTFVIEDTIKTNTHKVMVLNLPDYLNGLTTQNSKQLLKITATLCYKFNPTFNNQLCYCPLHISFGLFNTVTDDLIQLSKDMNKSKKALEEQGKFRNFKSGVSWSEDFYPPNIKPFNNSQKLPLIIRKKDLEAINNKLTIALRATYKDGIDPQQLREIQENEHPFSLVVNIEEQPINGTLSGNLHNAITAINTVENILTAEADLDVDLDLD